MTAALRVFSKVTKCIVIVQTRIAGPGAKDHVDKLKKQILDETSLLYYGKVTKHI
jgi:hypothetical protein